MSSLETPDTPFTFNKDIYDDAMAYMAIGINSTLEIMTDFSDEQKEFYRQDSLKMVTLEAIMLGAIADIHQWVGPKERFSGTKLHSGNFSDEDQRELDLLKADALEVFPQPDTFAVQSPSSRGAAALAFYCGWRKR